MVNAPCNSVNFRKGGLNWKQHSLRTLSLALLVAPPAIWGLFHMGKDAFKKEEAQAPVAARAPFVPGKFLPVNEPTPEGQPDAVVISNGRIEGVIFADSRKEIFEKHPLVGMTIDQMLTKEDPYENLSPAIFPAVRMQRSSNGDPYGELINVSEDCDIGGVPAFNPATDSPLKIPQLLEIP